MRYKLVEKGNPARRNSPKKWYAILTNEGTLSSLSLIKKTAKYTQINKTDVAKVIQVLLRETADHLLKGYSIKLKDFGTFRLSVSSDGVTHPQQFTSDNIREVRVIFTPDKTLKEKMEHEKKRTER
ncbi:MAG: HU family DNA-binding protein [Petrimonas sp.]|nr:HU family DNA-binding protein [Petrimonas sp.]